MSMSLIAQFVGSLSRREETLKTLHYEQEAYPKTGKHLKAAHRKPRANLKQKDVEPNLGINTQVFSYLIISIRHQPIISPSGEQGDINCQVTWRVRRMVFGSL